MSLKRILEDSVGERARDAAPGSPTGRLHRSGRLRCPIHGVRLRCVCIIPRSSCIPFLARTYRGDNPVEQPPAVYVKTRLGLVHLARVIGHLQIDAILALGLQQRSASWAGRLQSGRWSRLPAHVRARGRDRRGPAPGRSTLRTIFDQLVAMSRLLSRARLGGRCRPRNGSSESPCSSTRSRTTASCSWSLSGSRRGVSSRTRSTRTKTSRALRRAGGMSAGGRSAACVGELQLRLAFPTAQPESPRRVPCSARLAASAGDRCVAAPASAARTSTAMPAPSLRMARDSWSPRRVATMPASRRKERPRATL